MSQLKGRSSYFKSDSRMWGQPMKSRHVAHFETASEGILGFRLQKSTVQIVPIRGTVGVPGQNVDTFN